MLADTVDPVNEVTTHGFLLAVEMADGVDVESLMNRLADALTFIDGVGTIDIDHLGQVDMFAEDAPSGADIQDPVKGVDPLPAFVTGSMKES